MNPAPTSLHLPDELQSEIASHLDPWADKDSLLQLALVNRTWRWESQRILFSEMTNYVEGSFCPLDFDSLVWVHTRFLQTIINHPTRLGGCVRSYSQHLLASSPDALGSPDGNAVQSARIHLFNLTRQALPILVNLKNLALSLTSGCASDISLLLLPATATVQLVSLTWQVEESDDQYYHDLAAFLRTQHRLRHFRLAGTLHDETWIPPADACPELRSISCHISSVHKLANRTSIAAIEVDAGCNSEAHPPTPITENHFLVMNRCKFLSLHQDLARHILPGRSWPNLVLLSVVIWTQELLTEVLSKCPELRIFSVLDTGGPRRTPERDSAFILQCFKACGRLEQVILPATRFPGYDIFTAERLGDGSIRLLPGTTRAVVGDPDARAWWTIYDV